MSSRALAPLLLRSPRPPLFVGLLVAAGATALETIAIYPLEHVAPVVSLGVVYLLGVVIIATYWGIALGLITAVASALAFNYFHLPPVGHLTLADSGDWAALAVLIAVAAVTGVVGSLARARADEAEQRRDEADLATELARVLLSGTRLDVALAAASQRLASAIGVSSAAIELGVVSPDRRRRGFALHDGVEVIGTLVLPAALGEDESERVAERIVPALQSVLAAALHRAELQAEVVETALLRRNDEMKTALLRSVSHDLRTPLTAILSAATALDPYTAGTGDAAEAQAVVLEAATRLNRLVEKLLDLSQLQAGKLEQRNVPYSLEEVLHEAVAQIESDGDRQVFRMSLDADLPVLEGDPGQLERAFANLLENAARYSGGKTVSVRAHVVGERVRVAIVDQGPGIRASDLDRIFLPFYRAPSEGPGHQGSGLGLAIARGFVEVNGGTIAVESLPGQGTSFVVDFPLLATERQTGKRPVAPSAVMAPGRTS
jgi:two-component system, OmpR family, sensor histidine kinase KdpD